MADDIVFTTAQLLLNCLCAELAVNPNPPQECCLRIGTDVSQEILPQDLCCNGFGYVRIGGMFPAGQSFPDLDTPAEGCIGDRWAVELEMGVFRCDPDPDCDSFTQAARQYTFDAQAVRKALCCFRARLDVGWDWQPQQVNPLPLEGGCSGLVASVLVQVPGVCC